MNQFTKTISLLFTAIILYSGAFAQAPQGISYQAIARSSTGTILPNQNISLRFSIHNATSNGTVVYRETQSATTNILGLFSLFIGKGTPVTGTFATTDWASAPKFLQVEMDATGGTTYLDMGTQQMMSVPYSIYADKSGNGLGGGTSGQTLYHNGTNWDSTSSITNDVAHGKVNMKGTLTLSNDATAADDRYSLQIETAKPMMLPRMTQIQIDALTPIEGMTVFNTDAHKMQVYAMLTNNADILNEIYTGTYTDPIGPSVISQNFVSPISGQVVAIDVLMKNNPGNPPYPFDFDLNGSSQTVNIPNTLADFTWFTIILNTPAPVSSGSPSGFSFSGIGIRLGSYIFATNSFYPNGNGCCFTGADDLLFRIHIQPTPGSYGWQNLN